MRDVVVLSKMDWSFGNEKSSSESALSLVGSGN